MFPQAPQFGGTLWEMLWNLQEMQLWRTNVTAVGLTSLQSTLGFMFMDEDVISLLLSLPCSDGLSFWNCKRKKPALLQIAFGRGVFITAKETYLAS